MDSNNTKYISANKTKYFDAILGLAVELRKRNIPFILRDAYEGYQIVGYNPTTKEYDWDVAIHDVTYGSNRGLLEGCGTPFENDYDGVMGDLTVEDALDLIVKYYSNK